MRTLERWCLDARHARPLEGADWLWRRARPCYEHLLALVAPGGLERTINGTDRIRILPRHRWVPETYEPEVWAHLMRRLRPGDVVADIGAFIGLYAVALAKRLAPSGRVVAMEPDPANFAALAAHVVLNGVTAHVDLLRTAAGDRDGTLLFRTGRGDESRVAGTSTSEMVETVPCVRLDRLLLGKYVDIMKVDVEGAEPEVLEGAASLLSCNRHRPRLICIEIHPYAWPDAPATEERLLALLGTSGYRVFTVEGRPVRRLQNWGHIIAVKDGGSEVR